MNATVGSSFATSESSYTILRTLLPSVWIIRDHKPDFHIDYLVEPTEAGELTGKNVGIQLKGRVPKKSAVGPPTYSLKTKHILYYLEKCEFPVFLVLVDVRNRKGYWLFTQQFGNSLNREQLRKQKRIVIHFSPDDTFDDIPRFERAISDSLAFMRELRPSSIDAAVLHRQKELEAKDPRLAVQVDLVDGKQNLILRAKEEFPFSVSFKTVDPDTAEKIKDFFEKGSDLEIRPEEIEFSGSPLFDELPKNEKLRIQYRREMDGHALFSWKEASPEASVYVPGKCRIGEKFITFEGILPGSPFEMTVSVPWTVATTPEPFSMSLKFKSEKWQKQRLVALPHFESNYACFSALLEGKGVTLRLYCQGNLLGASKVSETDSTTLRQALNFLQSLYRSRVLARDYHVDPVLPNFSSTVIRDLMMVDELYSVLYTKGHRKPFLKGKMSFAARISQDAKNPNPYPWKLKQEIRGYNIFETLFAVENVWEEITHLKLVGQTPLTEPQTFELAFQTTEQSERIVQREIVTSTSPTTEI